ncbi:MAG: protein kinase, partial [Myxococcota bacterium]
MVPSAPSQQQSGRLDRYELVARMATGGMATVWYARLRSRHGVQKPFAIKTILPQYAGEESFRRMFLDEALLAANVVHPNVAQIFELGEEQGTLFIVMEWVDGTSLSNLRRSVEREGGSLDTGLVLRILADASAGLHAVHTAVDDTGNAL